MTKGECTLVVIIHVLLGVIAGLYCWFWQYIQNTEIHFQQMQQQITALQSRDEFHDSMIHAVIKTQALNGMFDTDARFIEAAERLSQIEDEIASQ